MRGLALLLLVPVTLAAVGALTMHLAVEHFEKVTGREFYGLAGYHYSMPEWGFSYHPGGERIEALTVTYPFAITSVLILLSAVVVTFRTRRTIGTAIIVVLAHLAVAGMFVLFAAWVSLNVTGVFI